MSWLAMLLVGTGAAALANRAGVHRLVPAAVGAVTVVGVGLLGGFTSISQLLPVLVIAGVVVFWVQTTRSALEAFASDAVWFSRSRALTPLLVLAGAALVCVAAASLAEPFGGPLMTWWEVTEGGFGFQESLPVSITPALLVLGVFLMQISAGNLLVRLVLAATGTLSPARPAVPGAGTYDPSGHLRGGRLLGPMERLLIVGLGLAGNLTAAAIVVAAKGLLRFPELSAPRDQEYVHRLTEYFLVGSFVSWTLALGGLALLAL